MGNCVSHVVVKSCVALYNNVHIFVDDHPTSNQAHRTLPGLQPSYESTYQKVHKPNFVGLRALVQTPRTIFFHAQ